jgi:hypothetical protein
MLNSEEEEFEALGDYEQDSFYEEELETVPTSAYGTFMNSGYRIECWSDNTELTSFMYYLLKYIFLKNRDNLSNNAGFALPRLTGGDLEPIPEYLPVFIFRRALILTGKLNNTVEIADINEIDEIRINQTLVEE